MGGIDRQPGKAVSLNPNDTWPLQNLFFNYQMQRNFEVGDRVMDRALAISPQSFSLWGLKASWRSRRRVISRLQKKVWRNLNRQKPGGAPKEMDSEELAEMGWRKPTS